MEEKAAGRGFLILSIAGILGKVLAALYVPLLTRIIGPDGYGIYSAGYDIFVFLFAVSTLGAQPAITKVVTELKVLGNHKDALRTMKIARNYLIIVGGLISIFFMIIANPLANITGNEESAKSFIFLAPAILFAAVLAAYRGYMQGIEDMETLAISSIVEQLVNVVLSLIFAFVLYNVSGQLEWGSAGGTIGTSLGAIVAIIYIMYIYEKKDYEEQAYILDKSTKKVSDKKIIRKLIKYGLPITLVAGIQNAAGLVDVITIKNRLEFAGFLDTTAMYGTLNQYKTLIYVPLTIITALATSIFPRIIQAFVERDKKELKRQMSYSFRLTYIIAIPATFGLAILSKEIFYLLFEATDTEYQLLMFGSSALILMSITTIQNVILQGINKFYLIMATASLGLLAKLIINYFLVGITNINIMGAVVGTFVAFAIPAVINHIKLRKIFKIKIPIIKQSIVPLISSIIMSFVIIFVRIPLFRFFSIIGIEGQIVTGVGTFILIAIGGLVYLVVMIYFGGIRKYDLDMISPRLYRLMPRKLRKQIGK